MGEDKKKKYLAMTAGYIGMLLLGLAILRIIDVFQDLLTQSLALFAYLLIVSYFKLADEKIGATSRDKMLFRGGLLISLGVIWIGVLL
ncbi:hypothetical protein [Ornithinibacillus halophilus]|uniref:Uncharacterized protein n=1 Tax=Ornithinibacillus halophilus TaxID=930117 RepID=A0A1M5MQJ6_9BACI|nr:hypothetical protein [Ornithinibacillus halophilus]SHG79053.1 hypothetical protein SAMN05216225_106217 [Ornithinibacillus halophilus]